MGESGEPRGRVGQLVANKWQIDERIGVGGMATVYAATHRTNGMRAAIKMLHAPLSRDQSTRARFLREGYVANSVGHEGVVSVLDDGVAEDGAAFLVLELLEGETIDARRHRLGGSIPIDEALEIGVQALDALAAAHGDRDARVHAAGAGAGAPRGRRALGRLGRRGDALHDHQRGLRA